MKTLYDLKTEFEKVIEINDCGVDNCSDTGVEAAKSQLECPVCLEMMKPPTKIWMCPQTHLVCEVCREGMESNVCPTCRS